ncbi:hypothetical protein Mapa_002597 [Marchantia paleacea]|nr:hypothetical protein Mapa_002597 [Marchantia paleacea]
MFPLTDCSPSRMASLSASRFHFMRSTSSATRTKPQYTKYDVNVLTVASSLHPTTAFSSFQMPSPSSWQQCSCHTKSSFSVYSSNSCTEPEKSPAAITNRSTVDAPRNHLNAT